VFPAIPTETARRDWGNHAASAVTGGDKRYRCIAEAAVNADKHFKQAVEK